MALNHTCLPIPPPRQSLLLTNQVNYTLHNFLCQDFWLDHITELSSDSFVSYLILNTFQSFYWLVPYQMPPIFLAPFKKSQEYDIYYCLSLTHLANI